MDVLRNPRDPSTRGSWIVDIPVDPQDPSTRGSRIMDLPVPSEEDPQIAMDRPKIPKFSSLAALATHIFKHTRSMRGSWIVDFREAPRDPSTRGSWIVDFPGDPRDPTMRGSWIVDYLKRQNPVQGGGCYKVTFI